jgi:hypothetical protein
MRIIELTNNIRMPITNEESDVMSKFDEGVGIPKSSLDIREQHLAAQLVNKGALIRKNNNGKVEYFRNINS